MCANRTQLILTSMHQNQKTIAPRKKREKGIHSGVTIVSAATSSCTMKALQFFPKGVPGPTIVEIPKPVPAHNEVLVKVVNSAIDTGLDAVVSNEITAYFIHSKKAPLYLGWHFAGRVEGFGMDVTDLAVGVNVFGHLQYSPSQRQGAFAEYIVVPRQDLAVKPNTVPMDVAAAASTESMTALQAMRDLGGLAADKSVLIIGSGGVGSMAVSIAKKLAAHVTVVCSPADLDRMKGLGADICLDRSLVNFLTMEGISFDVIFDTPSKYSAHQCIKKLHKNGVYVATVPNIGLVVGVLMTCFWYTTNKVRWVECHSSNNDLQLIGKWLEEGMPAGIDSTYAIKDMVDAMKRHKEKKGGGRVVISVENGWE